MRRQKKFVAKVMIGLVAVLLVAMSVGLAGCETTQGSGYQPDAEGLKILVETAEEALTEYLAAKVDDPTPEQRLVITLAKGGLRYALNELKEAGAYQDAARIRLKAGFDPEPEAEPLE